MADEQYELIVVGEGVAGLTAACVAARAGLRTAMFEAVLFGGLITNVNALDPAPKLAEGGACAMGADLAAGLFQTCVEAGAENIGEQIVALSRGPGGLLLRTEQAEYGAAQVIIASGAQLRALGVPGEAEFAGRGVSQCADCDGPLFRGQAVVVVGGGDSALQEALALAEYGAQVHLVHRRDRFRGRADLATRVGACANIRIHWNTELAAIEGRDAVEHVRLRAGGAPTELPCAGVFVYTGLAPNTTFLPADVALDEHGRVRTDARHLSSMPGVYAAGAARAGCGGTADDAMRDGREAAQSVIAHGA